MGHLSEQAVISFCHRYDYDIRKSHNGRWIDQKCTADVVSFVADCILNYISSGGARPFTTKDVWHYEYTLQNAVAIFKKPEADNRSARNEYDKFFQQPLEMLSYARVLAKDKTGNRNFYQVQNLEMLEYIALRERNALFFLKTYIEKVLIDSGLYPVFHNFFIQQTPESFVLMKNSFSEFVIRYTSINTKLECHRIFTKVLNPLAYCHNTCGTERGMMSRHKITSDMLMYNQSNFRDIYADKPKELTRTEHEANSVNNTYQSRKAKTCLKRFNQQTRNGLTEHLEPNQMHDPAVQIHHIFPERRYPEIGSYLENLIALTPSQQMVYAHPENNTRIINEEYQYQLLLSKIDRIKENLTDPDTRKIYDFSALLYVLSVGFDHDVDLDISDMDFNAVVNAVNLHYSRLKII